MKKRNVTKMSAIIAIPGLLYFVYVACSWSLADIYARPVLNAARDWKKNELVPTQEDWSRYQSSLDKALQHDPTNSEFYRTLGQVIEGPYRKYQLGDKEALEARTTAAEYYRESIKLRPTWPYGYVDLALVKFRLLQIDDEFYDAMFASMEYGPWEPDIQRVVSEIGMVLWNILEDREREFILNIARQSFMHANKTHVRSMQRIVGQRHFLSRVCEKSKHNADLLKYCDEKGGSAL